jgi:uncharacterized protein YwgA
MGLNSFDILNCIWDIIGPFNMDLFKDRLILQKKIFLLQEMGYDLGYAFNKYHYGPYCSALANDGFKKHLQKCSQDKKDLEDIKEFIEKLEKLEENHKGDSSWFELLGTITYLKNKMNKSKEEIKIIIIEEKPYLFDNKTFEEAYKKLFDMNIIAK